MFTIITQTDLKKRSLCELQALLRKAQSKLFNLPVNSLRYKIAGENVRLLQKEISTRQPTVKYQPTLKPSGFC